MNNAALRFPSTGSANPQAAIEPKSDPASLRKTELRQRFKRALGNYAGLNAARATGHLCFNLETFLTQLGAQKTWAAFQPFGFECDIRPALARLHSIDWVYPLVNTSTSSMSFYRADARTFLQNQWGILEPDPARAERVDLGSLQGLIIPALAYDSKCNRLGRGGGYYDRVLAELKSINPHACKIGVAFDIQISAETFPQESFDVPMDWVVTESRSFERTSP